MRLDFDDLLPGLIVLVCVLLVVGIVVGVVRHVRHEAWVKANCEPTPDTRWNEPRTYTTWSRVGDVSVPSQHTSPGYWERRYVCDGNPFEWVTE